MCVGSRRVEAVLFGAVDNHGFHSVQKAHKHIYNRVFYLAAAEHFDVLKAVINLELCKSHKSRQIHLAALIGEEFFKVIVAKTGVFDIDFAHNANLDLRHSVYLDVCKITAYFV